MRKGAFILLRGLLALVATSVRAENLDHHALSDLSRQVREIARQAADPAASMKSLSPLLNARLAGIGMSGATVPAPAGGAESVGVGVGVGNLHQIRVDFIMAQLKLQTGAEFNAHIHEALPGADAPALFIRGGRTSLTQLAEIARKEFPGALVQDGRTVTAQWPIIVWSDAELVLEDGDRLNLSTRQGAFILNGGVLKVSQATIAGDGGTNVGRADYHPFIVTTMTGAVQASGATFAVLGLPGSDSTSGVSIIGAALFPAKAHSFFIDSDFSDMGSLTLLNTHGVLISGNRFLESSGPAVAMKGVSNARILSNMVVGAKGAQGISLEGHTADVEVSHNIVLDSRGSGIFLANDVRAIKVSANLVSGNGRGGISVVRGSCIDVTNNIVFDNRQVGIKVRNSNGLTLSANKLIGNAGAGIAIVEQAPAAYVTINDNDFVANRSGIYGGSASEVALNRNDFAGQAPILLDGEFSAYVPRLLRSATQRQTVGSSPQSDVSAGPFIIHANGDTAARIDCQSGS